MGRHEATDDAVSDPVVEAALAGRRERGGAHSDEQPRRGPLGWPGPQRDVDSRLGWPGDLPR